VDAVRDIFVKKNIGLGRKFVVAVPEQKLKRDALESRKPVTGVGHGKPGSAQLFTGGAELFHVAGKRLRQYLKHGFLESGAKGGGVFETSKGQPLSGETGKRFAVPEQGVDIELYIPGRIFFALHGADLPGEAVDAVFVVKMKERQIVPFHVQLRQFFQKLILIHAADPVRPFFDPFLIVVRPLFCFHAFFLLLLILE